MRAELPTLAAQLRGILRTLTLPPGVEAGTMVDRFFARLPAARAQLAEDVEAAFDGDPAATSYAEIAAAYLYLAMSADFESKAFKGFARWMRVQFREEMDHALKVVDYMLARGATVAWKDAKAPATNFGSALETFEKTLAHEQEVTARIHRLYHLAAAVGVELIVKSPVETIERNVLGSHVVLRLASRYLRKVLITSTSEIYGKSDSIPFGEEDDRVLPSRGQAVLRGVGRPHLPVEAAHAAAVRGEPETPRPVFQNGGHDVVCEAFSYGIVRPSRSVVAAHTGSRPDPEPAAPVVKHFLLQGKGFLVNIPHPRFINILRLGIGYPDNPHRPPLPPVALTNPAVLVLIPDRLRIKRRAQHYFLAKQFTGNRVRRYLAPVSLPVFPSGIRAYQRVLGV